MTLDLIRKLCGLTASGLLLAALATPALSQDDKAGSKGGTATAEQPAPAKKKGKKEAPKVDPNLPPEPADKPAIKMANDQGASFLKRHEGFLADLKAANGDVGILFVGDSITDGWRKRGKETFDKFYGKDKPLNIGIGGDRTQHVIWRLENGEVEGISPKVAMLMIGTNNLAPNTDEEIVRGITKCVSLLHEKLPKTKVLLLAVFPRGEEKDNPFRARIKNINSQIQKLDDGGKTTKYLDIGEKFLEPDGTLPKSIMPDALHPNEEGYDIWAKAVQPALDELMK